MRLVLCRIFIGHSREHGAIPEFKNDKVNRPRPLLERAAHTAGRRSLEVQNEPRYQGALDTSLMSQPPCTRHRVGQYPDSSGLCSTQAAKCSDTKLPESAKARSCCPCSATPGLVGRRRSTGLAGSAAQLTLRLPGLRSKRCRDRNSFLQLNDGQW